MQSNTQEPEESEWVRRAQAGDEAAFSLLVERYQRRVFSLVFHLVHQPSEVEDLAQEIFVKVFRAIASYNFRASFGTWISRIAVNHCYDHLRGQRGNRLTYLWQLSDEKRQALENGVGAGSPAIESPEEAAAAKDLVAKLLERAPPEDRTVLVLREIEGRSVEEISEILNWTVSKVKVRLHRARKRMLADLKRYR